MSVVKNACGIDAIHVIYVWGATINNFADLPFNPCGKALPEDFAGYVKWIESNEGPEVRFENDCPERLKPYPFDVMMKSTMPPLGDDLRVEGANIGEPNDYPLLDHRVVVPFEGGPMRRMRVSTTYYGARSAASVRVDARIILNHRLFIQGIALSCAWLHVAAHVVLKGERVRDESCDT